MLLILVRIKTLFYFSDLEHGVQEKEVCIGIVTQIDLLTHITKHQNNKESKQSNGNVEEKDKDEMEEMIESKE